ncbi:hypothetical protein [Rhizobium lentis]|uniref:Uncharacterized protein n=1 Tax=Rhizobium lentis TaxID=1138194 RepID=A0A7W9CYR1_9HYPH|nr:hypothetical protein [Rhizobium lentis]MBB4577485.1 hypothetical protein [Rhizobium lentis]MBB5564705.1 hypothetical protein [Rhizobium lentis]MBB5571191.1 hypothetical protein [Rhizobium lentis]
MPKLGWIVENVNAACEKSYDLHGRPAKKRVGEITGPAAISLTTNITRSFFAGSREGDASRNPRFCSGRLGIARKAPSNV